MLLKIKEVADRFQVTPRTIRQQIKKGNIPAVKIGRVWRIRPESINLYLDKNETKSKPQLDGLPGCE